MPETAWRALERTAPAMGAREGTEPEDNPLMRSQSTGAWTKGHEAAFGTALGPTLLLPNLRPCHVEGLDDQRLHAVALGDEPAQQLLDHDGVGQDVLAGGVGVHAGDATRGRGGVQWTSGAFGVGAGGRTRGPAADTPTGLQPISVDCSEGLYLICGRRAPHSSIQEAT